jgi:hypothetical protein
VHLDLFLILFVFLTMRWVFSSTKHFCHDVQPPHRSKAMTPISYGMKFPKMWAKIGSSSL